MRKFFVDISQVNENKITICGDDVNHIKNVLRLDTNEKILVGVKNVEKSIVKMNIC